MWLNVAEKPSVAKEVASVLSSGQARQGRSHARFNPVFEFPFSRGRRQVTMVFTSVLGHLMDIDFPPHMSNWNTTPFHDLFTAPLAKRVKEDFSGIEQNLKELGRRATRIVLWLDCDREGENIAFEVLEVVRGSNPRIAVSRAIFSALTPRDLLRAMDTLGEPNRAASEAVDTRQEMDLRIGAAFTRFQSVVLRPKFQDLPRVLSFGPCQMPCLGFVVERFLQRKSFIPQPFATISMKINSLDGETIVFNSSRGRIFDLLCALTLFEECIAEKETQVATLTHVENRPRHRNPPAPLATVELQKLASRHLRMSSERCMSMAESLYQEGFLSYPRTETDVFTFTDDELKDLARSVSGDPRWNAIASSIADGSRFQTPRNGGHNDNAHPPIHPTKLFHGEGDDKARLYELVVRHFLASMTPDAVAAETSVTAEYGGETFHTSGQSLIDPGWYAVFTYERWGNTVIPNFTEGQQFQPIAVSMQDGKTEPPALLREAQLIGLMDDKGIGTDATIASHIKTIQDRKYVEVDNSGFFIPTPLGLAIATSYHVIGLRDMCQPLLRAQMEAAMSDIVRGTTTKHAVLNAAIEKYSALLEVARGRTEAIVANMKQFLGHEVDPLSGTVVQEALSRCGICNDAMLRLERSHGGDAFCRCTRCAIILPIPLQFSALRAADGVTCTICNFGVLLVSTDRGTSFPVCPHCLTRTPDRQFAADIEHSANGHRCSNCTAECQFATGQERVPITKCPQCRSANLRLKRFSNKGNYSISCSGYPACRYSFFLPACEEASVGTSSPTCSQCSARKISFKFCLLQAPPMIDPIDVLCVLCDSRLDDFVSRPRFEVATPAVASSEYVLPDVSHRGRGRARGRGGRSGGTAAGNRAGNTMNVQCQCSVLAKEFTSKKESSKGRKFLTCGNNRSCNFFQWIE